VRIAKAGGSWYTCVWANPANGDRVEPKLAYITRAGDDWLLGAGMYLPVVGQAPGGPSPRPHPPSDAIVPGMPISPPTPKPRHDLDPGCNAVTYGAESPLRDPARFHVATDSRGSCVLLPDQVKAVAVGAEQARLLAAAAADPDEGLQARAGELLTTLGISPTAEPLEAARPAPPSLLRTLLLVLTRRCNLRCVYCYEHDWASDGPADMPPATARAAVDRLFDHGDRWAPLTFYFFGGEPLLNRPALRAAVGRAERRAALEDKRVQFGITTNGVGLDAGTVEYLGAHEFHVTVSIDGSGARHDAQRPFATGGGSFTVVAAACERLLRTLPDAIGRATLLPGADPSQVRRELEEIGFRRVVVKPATPSSRDARSRPGTHIDERGERTDIAALEDEARAIEAAVRRRDGETLRSRRDLSRMLSLLELFAHGRRRIAHCGAGSALVAVDPGGGVYPCQRFVGDSAWQLDDIATMGASPAGEHPPPWPLRAQCLSCPARFTCAGGCPHQVSVLGGDLRSDDCAPHIREVELAALVSSRLDPEARAFLRDEGVVGERPCPLDLF